MVKNFGSNNITVLYPNLCYKKVCYIGTALYLEMILEMLDEYQGYRGLPIPFSRNVRLKNLLPLIDIRSEFQNSVKNQNTWPCSTIGSESDCRSLDPESDHDLVPYFSED